MVRLRSRCVCGAAALVLVAGAQVWGAFNLPLALQKIMNDSSAILVTQVEKIDPAKPSMVLVVKKALKGKTEFERLPINLKGDADSDKLKQTPELLKRLAPELPVVAFLSKLQDGSYMMFAYTNGTWFQVIGQGESNNIRWSYTHCEINFRRTFKGTTAEMEQTITDVLAKKRRAPAIDPKEKPGLGPVVEAGGG